MSIVLWIVGVLLVIVGIAGIIFPALPGHVLIFAGLLLAAWASDFTRVGGWTLALIGVIGALSYTVDFVAAALGAKRVGASRARWWARDWHAPRHPVRAPRRAARTAGWRGARRVDRPSAMETRGGRGHRGVDRLSDWNGGEGRTGVHDDRYLHRRARLALNGTISFTGSPVRRSPVSTVAPHSMNR